MFRSFLHLGLFGCLSISAVAVDEFRTFTNANGASIRARLIGEVNGQATIRREDGQEFTIATATLSAEDQDYIRRASAAMSSGFITRPSPNDGLPVQELNDLIGAELFGDSVLWEGDAEGVAQRLKLPLESKTPTQGSYRSYPPEDTRLFGARPYTVALYSEHGKPVRLSMVFANKGDSFGAKGSAEQHFDRDKPEDVKAALATLKEAMDKDVLAVTSLLRTKLGEPQKERFGETSTRRDVYRWDWRGHSILLAEKQDEYVGIEITPQAFADAGGRAERVDEKLIRAQAGDNVERRENGDVIIRNIPMVDQGPKGYCAPATAERAMRYLGVPADMYLLAMAGQTGIGGGTSVETMLDAVGNTIRTKGRSFDSWRSEPKLRDLQKYIDKGVPVIWGLYSSDEWNKTANERTKERTALTEWGDWTSKMTEVSEQVTLVKDRDSAHVVLVIGYNEGTGEIAFSDSWGERYMERWMTLAEAKCVSMDAFWVVSF